MKIQKILLALEPDSKAFLIKQIILSRLDDLNDIKEKIIKYESDLEKEVLSIFYEDPKLKEFYPFFHLNISNHNDDPDYKNTLINAICKQIAQSLKNLYDVPEEKENPFVNYGGKHFTISAEEIFKHLDLKKGVDLTGMFEKFNEAMQTYDIRIKQLNFVALDTSPLSIHIRILK